MTREPQEEIDEEPVCNECEAKGTHRLDFNDEYIYLCAKHYNEVSGVKKVPILNNPTV